MFNNRLLHLAELWGNHTLPRYLTRSILISIKRPILLFCFTLQASLLVPSATASLFCTFPLLTVSRRWEKWTTVEYCDWAMSVSLTFALWPPGWPGAAMWSRDRGRHQTGYHGRQDTQCQHQSGQVRVCAYVCTVCVVSVFPSVPCTLLYLSTTGFTVTL